MTFRVGQLVVFVDDNLNNIDPRNFPGGYYVPHWPVKGNVYKVREIEDGFLRLVEIVNPIRDFTEGRCEAKFIGRRFRPLVDTSQSVSFTAGAPKDSEQWDGRKKVHERT